MLTHDIPIEKRLIFSVFDYSEAWPGPYIRTGYPTLLWDYKKEGCLARNFSRVMGMLDDAIEAGYIPWGLLLAPPCTDISSAAAWTWKDKDQRPHPEIEGWTVTEWSQGLVELGLHLALSYPWKFWTLENPPGRIEALVPELAFFRRMSFNPFDYGDPYTKKTILWGDFNTALPKMPVEPELVRIKAGNHFYHASSLWVKTGGKSEKTKALRSNTPAGFANAFFTANP